MPDYIADTFVRVNADGTTTVVFDGFIIASGGVKIEEGIVGSLSTNTDVGWYVGAAGASPVEWQAVRGYKTATVNAGSVLELAAYHRAIGLGSDTQILAAIYDGAGALIDAKTIYGLVGASGALFSDFILNPGANTNGDLLVYDSTTGRWINLAAGGVGFFLESKGAGVKPAWTKENWIIDPGVAATGDLLVGNAATGLWDILTAGAAGAAVVSTGAGAKPTYQAVALLGSANTFTAANTFNAQTLIGGRLQLTPAVTGAALGGATNNYEPAGLTDANHVVIVPVLRIQSSLAINLTGLGNSVANAGQQGGTMLLVENIGAFAITLVHESAASFAFNRFNLPGAANKVLNPGALTWLYYNGTLGRWTSL